LIKKSPRSAREEISKITENSNKLKSL